MLHQSYKLFIQNDLVPVLDVIFFQQRFYCSHVITAGNVKTKEGSCDPPRATSVDSDLQTKEQVQPEESKPPTKSTIDEVRTALVYTQIYHLTNRNLLPKEITMAFPMVGLIAISVQFIILIHSPHCYIKSLK